MGSSESVGVRSYTLRVGTTHVRATPRFGLDGCAFGGPAVDICGNEARAILSLASPVSRWLEAREPGVRLRSFAVDLDARRVLVTLEANDGEARPRVVRFDAPYAEELIEAGRAVESAVSIAASGALSRRSSCSMPSTERPPQT